MACMRNRHRSAALAAAAMAVAVASLAAPAGAGNGTTADRSANRVTMAVIGDVPYGTAQEPRFGDLIGAVNDDPKVRAVVHVGDIKSGSTTCTDERFAAVEAALATFEDPLVYTPGGNEWTDCHRVNNGAYNPLERLAAVRARFFPEPGLSLGRRARRVESQPALAENVRWVESHVAFATLHVIGSDNGLAPWCGLGFTTPTPAQVAEVNARIGADIAWVDATFDAADDGDLEGVVLAIQADTWGPVPSGAQRAIVDRIVARAATFDGQVLVLQGDLHAFTADHPLPLANVTRIVVHGEKLPFEYLRLTIDPRDPALFSWERVRVP